MDKTFQQDYAKIVIDFAQKMPPELNFTTQEIDAYFRECIFYLISYNEQMKSSPNPRIINQLYTEAPVRFSSEQLASKIDCSQADKSEGTAIPDFFRRMLTADATSGTRNCCEFIRVQREVLMLYASHETTVSFEESRRLAFLNDRLTAMCEQEGVKEAAMLAGGETTISQDAAKSLNSSLEESANVVFKKQRSNTSKYARYTEREREADRTDMPEDVQKIVEKVDRKVEGMLSPKKSEGKMKKENSALFLANSMFGGASTDEQPNGKLPSWAKDFFPDEEDKDQDGQDTKPTVEESLLKLDGMIGLNSVKQQVRRLVGNCYISELRAKENLKNPPIAHHLVFTGNPGTGKTTVARILADIYAALGVLREGQLVEVDRTGLVAGYLGQTEEKTSKVIESALGGVLFIDEAYALAGDDGKADEFGQAAIDTILKAMEDHYDDLVVIVAGYDKKMDGFMASNPGLKSRFSTVIKFEDYDGEQLYSIFQRMVQDGDDRLDEQASAVAKKYFNHMYEMRDENFGNGRDVRNCYDRIRTLRADRLIRKYGNFENMNPTKEELMTFTLDDIKSLIMYDSSVE